MTDKSEAMSCGLRLKSPERALDAVPVIVMFHMNQRGVEPFMHIPSVGRLFDGQPNAVSARREFSIDHHRATSEVHSGQLLHC
jgi:hypothetical protein